MQTLRRSKGFTLVELMLVVGIVAILAAIALPNYTAYVRRSQRTDATAALLRIAAQQEKFYLQNNTYSNSLAALGVPTTESNLYTLSLAGVSGTGYTATATAPATSNQISDLECRSFTINQASVRTAVTSASAVNTARCWR